MDKEGSKISCLKFQKQESLIRDIIEKINMARVVQQKARFAEELEKEVGALLSCADHDSKRLDCGHCHFIATLRKKTANLIIKAKKL